MRARYTRARALWICLLKRVRLVDDASKHEPLSECGSRFPIDQWLAFARPCFPFRTKESVYPVRNVFSFTVDCFEMIFHFFCLEKRKKKKVVDLNCNFERFVFKREEFLAGVFIYFFIYFYELCIIQLRFRWRWIERFPSREEVV